MRHDVDTADIQAIAYSGFGSLGGARYLLLRVADPKASRHWLRSLEVSSVAKTLGNVSQRLSEVKQVAFTAAGLRAIGVENEVVSRFAPEFVDGMAGSENRSRRLGDVGPNAPSAWSWGSGNCEPHVLLMMFASTAGIEPVVEQILSELDLAGFELIESLNTTDMD